MSSALRHEPAVEDMELRDWFANAERLLPPVDFTIPFRPRPEEPRAEAIFPDCGHELWVAFRRWTRTPHVEFDASNDQVRWAKIYRQWQADVARWTHDYYAARIAAWRFFMADAMMVARGTKP